MRLNKYPKATSFDPGDVLLKDGVGGTKVIAFEDAIPSNSDLIAQVSQINDWDIKDIQTRIQPIVEMTNKIDGKTFVGWTANNSTNTIVGNTLKNVGGSTTSPSAAATNYSLVSGRRYFIKAKVRVTYAGEVALCTEIKLGTASGSALVNSILSPVKDTWYELYAFAVMDATAAIRIRHYYASTTDAGNSELQVESVSVIDVADIITEYPLLSKYIMNNTLNFLENDYLDGTQDVCLRGYYGDYVVLGEMNGVAQMHNTSMIRPLAGKTIVCFGDSLTQDVAETSGYTFWMESITGANVINQGYGGTAINLHADPNFDAFGISRLLTSYLTNTWTVQETALSNWAASAIQDDKDRAISWTTQLNKLKAIDFNDVYAVTLFYGGNSNGATIAGVATPDATLATYDGAYSYTVEQLQSNYHELGIVILGNMFKITVEEDRSLLLLEAAKMVSEYHNVPFYDTYHCMGFNDYNFDYTHLPAYSIDNKHPSTMGKKRMGERFSAFIQSAI